MRTHRSLPRLLAFPAAALLLGSLGLARQVGNPVSLGPFGGTANAVLVDPLDASTLYAATFEDGLLRSTDGGASFLPYGTGITGLITHLQADPTTPTTLYALVDTQIFRSLDSGATWSPLSLTLPSTTRSLSISGSLMLANDVGEVWRSDDAGATWMQVYTGTVFCEVAFAPSNPSIAYLGRLSGVDKSIDGGLTWAPTAGLTNWGKAIAVDPTDENKVYVGSTFGNFDLTIDGGMTSSSINTGWSTSSAQFVRFLPGSTTSLYSGALDGIWRTNDGGTTWNAVNLGLGNVPPIPNQIAFGGNDVYLATDNGFFHLANQMPPWNLEGFATVSILDVTFGSPGGQRLAAADKGIYRANPGQQLQQSKYFFDFGAHTDVVLVDPDDPGRWISGGVGSFIDNAQVRILQNDGQQVAIPYEVFGAGTVDTLAMCPADADQMLGGVSPNAFGAAGIIRSDDRGASWSDVPGTIGWPIVSVAWDPHDPNHAVAYFLDHRWAESTDAGMSFVEQTGTPWAGTGTPVRFAFDPFDPMIWYRVTTGEGLWRSEDAGQTWNAVGTTANAESDLELDPGLEGHLWYTDGAGQLLISTDRGDTFEPSFSLSGVDTGAIAYDASTDSLLLGTVGASAWEIDDASPFAALGGAATTSTGAMPSQTSTGGLPRVGNGTFALAGSYTPAGAIGVLALSQVDPNVPLLGGTLHVSSPFVDLELVPGGPDFTLSLPIPSDPSLSGASFFSQYAVLDGGIVLSDAVATTVLP